MSPRRRVLAWSILIPTVLAVGISADTGEEPRPADDPRVAARARSAVEAKLRRLDTAPIPHDAPDAAEAFYHLERQSTDGKALTPAERYDEARRHMATMPRYSTRLGHRLPPRSADDPVAAKAESLARWSALGPGNIGGRVRALVVHPQRPNTLWAGGVSGGLWKTTNGGASWTPLADLEPNIAVSSLAIDPNDPDVLYAGTGEGFLRELIRGTVLPLRGGGILKSINGNGFFRLPSTNNANFHWVNDIVVSPRDSERVYAATRTGVWRSSNGGGSWQRILATGVLGGCLDLALRPDTATDVLFATCGTFTRATVYRHAAAEGGGSFEAVLSEAGMGRTSLAIAPSNPSVIYALAARSGEGNENSGLHAVFRSDSGGDPGSWQPRVRSNDSVALNRHLLSNALTESLVACGFGPQNRTITLGWYANIIAVDPTNPDVVWAGGVDLFRSEDGGANWGLVSYWWDSPPSAHADQHVIRFHPNYDGGSNQVLFLGGDGGVWRSNNARAPKATGVFAPCNPANTAVRWSSLNNGLGITQFYHGTPFPDGRRFFGGTQDNGTLLGTLGGGIDGWRHILGGDGGYVAVDPVNPQILYAETQHLAFRKSVDGGNTFELAIDGIAEGENDVLFIVPFTLDPGDRRRLWLGGRRLWRTDNAAASWQQASPRLSGSAKVSAIAVDPGDSNRVYAGLTDGFVHRSGTATTSGAGSAWPASRPRSGYVSWIAVDPSRSDVVYATYAGFGGIHVWKSTDGAVSWSPLAGSGAGRLPDIPVHSIVVDPDHPERLFLGTDLGVFTTADGGETWNVENTGFANAVTETLSLVRPNPGQPPLLYAFTHGRGAWRVEVEPFEPVGGGGGDDGTVDVEPSVCEPSPTVACLGADGRFEIEVAWRDFVDDTGSGSLVDGGTSPDSALFWFFEPANWEMLIKVIDGCAFNGRRWVFSAALTNVEYSVTVTDTVAGKQRTYTNTLGQAAPAVTDTAAFATCP